MTYSGCRGLSQDDHCLAGSENFRVSFEKDFTLEEKRVTNAVIEICVYVVICNIIALEYCNQTDKQSSS